MTDPRAADVAAFVARWQDVQLTAATELSASQTFVHGDGTNSPGRISTANTAPLLPRNPKAAPHAHCWSGWWRTQAELLLR